MPPRRWWRAGCHTGRTSDAISTQVRMTAGTHSQPRPTLSDDMGRESGMLSFAMFENMYLSYSKTEDGAGGGIGYAVGRQPRWDLRSRWPRRGRR